jgi:hypothetical protein
MGASRALLPAFCVGVFAGGTPAARPIRQQRQIAFDLPQMTSFASSDHNGFLYNFRLLLSDLVFSVSRFPLVYSEHEAFHQDSPERGDLAGV